MIELSKENFVEQAKLNLLRYPLFEEEFKSVLRIPMSVSKNMGRYFKGVNGGSLKLMVNDTLTFFNYFDTEFACRLFLFLSSDKFRLESMSVMKLLGRYRGCDINPEFYELLVEETKGVTYV